MSATLPLEARFRSIAKLVAPLVGLLGVSTLAAPSHAGSCDAAEGSRCYYVAPDGSGTIDPTEICRIPDALDCSGGTQDAPWASALTAAACAGPGDIVYFREGTYGPVCSSYNGSRFGLFTLHDGTADAPITYRAFPGENARLTSTASINFVETGGAGDYTVIEDFEVTDLGIIVWADNVVVRNNHVHDVTFACSSNNGGIKLEAAAQNAIIEGNRIHDNFERDNGDSWRDVAGFAANCSGIKFMHDPSGHIVRGNEIYNEPAGVHLKYFGEGVDNLFEGNHIHDCGTGIYGSNNGWSARGNVFEDVDLGIRAGGGSEQTVSGFDVSIDGNTFVDWAEAAVYVGAGDPVLRDNIYAKRSGGYAVFVYNGGNGGPDGYPNQDLSALTMDGNCFHTDGEIYRYGLSGMPNSYHDLQDVQATFAQELRSIFADPQFVDAAAGDYRLERGSPCEGKGALIEEEPEGGSSETGDPDPDGGSGDTGVDDDDGTTGSSSGGAMDASSAGGGVSEGSTGAGDTDAASGTDGADAAEDEPNACACRADVTPVSSGLWLALALLWRRRRAG